MIFCDHVNTIIDIETKIAKGRGVGWVVVKFNCIFQTLIFSIPWFF